MDSFLIQLIARSCVAGEAIFFSRRPIHQRAHFRELLLHLNTQSGEFHLLETQCVNKLCDKRGWSSLWASNSTGCASISVPPQIRQKFKCTFRLSRWSNGPLLSPVNFLDSKILLRTPSLHVKSPYLAAETKRSRYKYLCLAAAVTSPVASPPIVLVSGTPAARGLIREAGDMRHFPTFHLNVLSNSI